MSRNPLDSAVSHGNLAKSTSRFSLCSPWIWTGIWQNNRIIVFERNSLGNPESYQNPTKTSDDRPKPSVCYTRHPFHPLKTPSGAILRWDDDFHWNHENHKISWNSCEISTFPLSEHAQKHCEFASQIDARRISRKLSRFLSFYARSREFVAESPLFCLPDEHPFTGKNFIKIHGFQEMAEFPDTG